MENLNQKWLILSILIIVVLLIGGAFFFRPTIFPSDSNLGEEKNNTATTSRSNPEDNLNVRDEDIPGLTVPDFRAPIKFAPSISKDVRGAVENGFTIVKNQLTTNSFDLKSWVDLGTLKKIAGDYRGAEEAWLFVTTAAPNSAIAYNNLGDLYTNFLQDYPKAETMYLTAIKVSPSEAGAYRDLANLYDNLYKKGAGAGEAILKKGVTAAPDSIDLHVILARYYKAAGKSAEAKAQYEAAIALANTADNTNVVTQLKAESGL